MKTIRRICRIAVMMGVVMLILSTLVSAKPSISSSYAGYQYNSYGESSAAPVNYLPAGTITSESLKLNKGLNSPTDLFYDNVGILYLLDSGNSRIIAVSTTDFSLKHVYDHFSDAQGNEIEFEGAQGLAVNSAGDLYIADTKQFRILIFDKNGSLKMEIDRPDEALNDSSVPFDVKKILVDNKNQIYVLCSSINSGIMTFSPEGKFLYFFGNNTVEVTADIIKSNLMNRFLTKEQRELKAKITPINFSNLTADHKGFVYTIKSESFNGSSDAMVQCLNYTGTNVLYEIKFGDMEYDTVTYYWERMSTSFIDLDVDDSNSMYILDAGRGKIYQYDENGYLMGVFGGFGNQDGTFTSPSAIETAGGKVFVSDSRENTIQIFGLTTYGNALASAYSLSESTDLQKRLKAWGNVLCLNSNNTGAYYEIGTVYDELGLYKQAMNYFKIAGVHSDYSKAFQQYRKQYVRDNALWIIVFVLAFGLLAFYVLKRIRRKLAVHTGTAYTTLEKKYTFPLYTAIHPVDGFEQFRSRKCESYRLATFIIFLWFAGETAAFFCTGFTFNNNRVIDYQLFVTAFKSFGLFILFVAANWSICTLLNGKGAFKEIYTSIAYALLPYAISMYINIILSNVLTENESIFLVVIHILGLLWSVVLVIAAVYSIHQYSFSQTIGAILLTLIAMAIISFLIILFYTLILQVGSFASSIIEEMILKFR